MAGSARAATLAFTGTLSLQIDPRAVETAVIHGSGVASVTDDGSFHLLSFGVASGAFGPFTATLSDSYGTAGPVRVTGVGNLSGSFSGLSGGAPAAGVMGLSGLAKLCIVFDPTCSYVFVPIPLSPTPALAVGLGIGGTHSVSSGAVSVTLQHSPWHLGAVGLTVHNENSAITTLSSATGFAHGPASLTSSTAQESGTVQLVTATKAYTTLIPELPIFATLSLHFVPEPSTLLLASAGVAGLVAASRSR
jgi:hypothetical protein